MKYRELAQNKGELQVQLLNKKYIIPYPELVAHEAESRVECEAEVQALLLHYLGLADGTPLAHRWVSFSELPNGGFYYRAFQSYSGDRLVRSFGNDLEGFCRAAEETGGIRISFGDASFSFQALPRVSLAIVYWVGDEEFPPTAKVLFDASASHYLPIDGLAVLGRWLCSKLIKAKEAD